MKALRHQISPKKVEYERKDAPGNAFYSYCDRVINRQLAEKVKSDRKSQKEQKTLRLSSIEAESKKT